MRLPVRPREIILLGGLRIIEIENTNFRANPKPQIKRSYFRRKSLEGRVEGGENDASQPYRFGSRSVPRRPLSFDFAELDSPHAHTLKRKRLHPYIESGNRFCLLMYAPRPPVKVCGVDGKCAEAPRLIYPHPVKVLQPLLLS